MSHQVFGVVTGTNIESLTVCATKNLLQVPQVIEDGSLLATLKHIASILLPYHVPTVILTAKAVDKSPSYAAAVVATISSMRGRVYWVGKEPAIDGDAEQSALEALRLQAAIAPSAPAMAGAGVIPMRIGRPPFGYDRRSGKLSINAGEARIIKDVFEMRAKALLYSDILTRIQDAKYMSGGKNSAVINIKHWDKTRVGRILRAADAYERGIFRTANGGKYTDATLIIVTPKSTP